MNGVVFLPTVAMQVKLCPFFCGTTLGQTTLAWTWRWLRMLSAIARSMWGVFRLTLAEVLLLEDVEDVEEPQAASVVAIANASTSATGPRRRPSRTAEGDIWNVLRLGGTLVVIRACSQITFSGIAPNLARRGQRGARSPYRYWCGEDAPWRREVLQDALQLQGLRRTSRVDPISHEGTPVFTDISAQIAMLRTTGDLRTMRTFQDTGRMYESKIGRMSEFL